MLRVGGGQLTEIDAEFKFAKIQNSYVRGWGWGGLTEIDAEFKFAKIQNSYVWRGGLAEIDAELGGGAVAELLMLSPNLLLKKIFLRKIF